MACKISVKDTVYNSIANIAGSEDVFSKEAAIKKARRINAIWGDKTATITQYRSEGGYKVVTHNLDKIIEREYEKQLRIEQNLNQQLGNLNNDIPTSEAEVSIEEEVFDNTFEFYNVNNPDKLRQSQIRSLNSLLDRSVRALGFTKTTIKKYNEDYQRRNPGKKLNQQGLINLIDKQIALGERSEIDGVTYAEEVFHGIVAANETAQEFQDIINLRDADGILEISKTDIYKKNYETYMSAYGGDENKVKLEIVGKLLAQAIYDKFAYDSIPQKLLRAIDKFFSFFTKKLRLANLLDRNQFNKDLYAALDIVMENWQNDMYNHPFTTAVPVTVPFVFKEINNFEDTIIKNTSELRSKVRQLEERQGGLIGNYNTKYEDLTKKYSGISNKTKYLADLEAKATKTPLSRYEQQQVSELKEYFILKNIDDIDVNREKQVKTINGRIKEINNLINKNKLQLGIHTYFFGINNSGGANEDIEQLYKYMQKVVKQKLFLSMESWHSLNESYNLHINIINELRAWYQDSSNGRNEFPELTKEQNKRLKDVVFGLKVKLDWINTSLNSSAKSVKRDFHKKYVDLNPNIDTTENNSYTEIGNFRKYFGSLRNAQDETARLFYKTIMDVNNLVHNKVLNNTIDFYNKHKDLIKRMGPKEFNKLREKDASGNQTHYWLSDRLTSVFEFNYNSFRETTIKNLIIYAKQKHNKDYNIPFDEFELSEFFNATTLNNISSAVLDNELLIREELRNMYNAAYGNWISLNTELKYNYEDIIEQRRLSMNKTKFAKWLQLNAPTHTYTKKDGTVVTTVIYKGELIKPSSGQKNLLGNLTEDYTNPEYNRLRSTNPEYIELLEDLKEKSLDAKRKLPLHNYSWEYSERLPQVSKSTMDLFGSSLSNYTEKFKESFSARPDDDMYANRAGNTILERPPIRFIEKINPDLITDDLFKSVMMVEEMSVNFVEFTKELPTLHGILDLVKRGDVVDKGIRLSKNPRDSVSDLEKKMRDVMLRSVYGGKDEQSYNLTIGSVDLNKVLDRLKKYIRNVRLLGNTTAQLTGYFSAMLNKSEEIYAKNLDGKLLLESEKEMYLHTISITNDAISPIKTSKLTAALQYTGLVTNNIETFANVNRSKLLRAASKTINYGGWETIDVLVKLPIIMTIAKEIRLVNGKWYTKNSYTVDDDGWLNGESLWGMMELEDNKIKFDPRVTQQVKDLWLTKSRVLANQIDGQLSDLDKASIHNHFLFKFFTINMNWLYERLDRGFKKEIFDWQTQQVEGGYYVVIWRAIQRSPIQFVSDVFKHNDQFTELEKQSLRRVAHTLVAATMLFMFVYIVTAISLDDDDDDDNPMLAYFIYILNRLQMEENSKTSSVDLFSYITRPADGIDQLDDYLPIVKWIAFLAGESEEVESGIYKGYDQSTKKLIQATPLLKGFYENIGGGVINEALGKPETSITTAISGKNQVIKSKINSDMGNLALVGMGLFTRFSGWALGRTIAPVVSKNYKSSFMDLPTKKAQKDKNK